MDRLSKLYNVIIDGMEVQVHQCRVSAIPFNRIWPGAQRPIEQTEEAAYVICETNECANIKILPNREFNQCVIRPLSKNVQFVISNGEVHFSAAPGQYTVELDGQHNALHLFIDRKDSIERFRETANVYFGAGTHELGRYQLKSNSTVFIDRNALVFGSFFGRNIRNINIVGYGTLSGEHDFRTSPNNVTPSSGMGPEYPTGAIQIFESRNIHIEGITFLDAAYWTMTFCACENIIIDNIKHVGMWRYNADGMDIICTKNVIVRNSFFRNFDDVIVPNGRIPWDKIATENILVENCVCWCDWGRTLEIGAITRVDEIRNITFRNCDLIHNMHVALDIQNTQWADVYKIHWENIRVEYSKDCLAPVYQESDDMVYEPVDRFLPTLLHIDISESYIKPYPKIGYNHDIFASDIHIIAEAGLGIPPVEVYGFNDEHKSWNVYLENITYNGQRIKDAKDLNLKVNEFTGAVYLDGKQIN